MCESYFLEYQCGNKKAEIFFGKMLLNESSVKQLFCPNCSQGYEDSAPQRIWDNGWVLELNMEIIRKYSSSFGMPVDSITADWIFDHGYVTWLGITPDDTETRNQEREQIQQLSQTDILAYVNAMKKWGIEREERFSKEGWRKMHR